VVLRDFDRGETRRVLRGPGRSLAFSPDGAFVHNDSQVWEVATGRELQAFRGDYQGGFGALAFSPGGKVLAAGGCDPSFHRQAPVWLREPATGKRLRELAGHAGSIRALAFSPDGKTLASSGEDRAVCLWDVATGTRLYRDPTAGVLWRLAFSPDGRWLAGCNGRLAVWRLPPGGTPEPLHEQDRFLCSVAFAPDGRTVVTGGSRIRRWDAGTGRLLSTFPAVAGGCYRLAVDPAGRLLASAGSEDAVRLWDTASGREVSRLPGKAAGLAFSPDGRTLATGGEGIRFWAMAGDGNGFRRIARPTHMNYTVSMSLAFSPDGTVLASGPPVTLFDLADGRTLASFKEVNTVFGFYSMSFTADGTSLAVPGLWVLVYDWQGKRLRRSWQVERGNAWSAVFSPDGRMVATDAGDEVRLWEVATGRLRRSFRAGEAGTGTVAFSPDGTRVAAVHGSSTVLLWDVFTGDQLVPLMEGGPADQLAGLWTALGDADAARAWSAACTLKQVPGTAVPFLRDRVRALPRVPADIARRVAELDSNELSVQRQAESDLKDLGEYAEAAVRQALAGTPSPEVREGGKRILAVLASREVPATHPDHLRGLRALEIL
jgi:WD40 repeat protein